MKKKLYWLLLPAISAIIIGGAFLISYYSNGTSSEVSPTVVINVTPKGIISEGCANYPSPKLVEVLATDWRDGPIDAPISAIEYGDFQCPGCAKMADIMKRIKPVYGDRLVRVFRHFPSVDTHRYAMVSAEAAEAAGAQDKFWEYHDVLFTRQADWSGGLNREVVRIKLFDYAKIISVSNTSLFKSDLDQNIYEPKIEKHYVSAVYAGLTRTPSLFVNGVLYPLDTRPLSLKSVQDFIDLIAQASAEGRCLSSL